MLTQKTYPHRLLVPPVDRPATEPIAVIVTEYADDVPTAALDTI